jgi:hypothetical protein
MLHDLLTRLGHPGISVTAYDASPVREANLGRQRFQAADLGSPKHKSWSMRSVAITVSLGKLRGTMRWVRNSLIAAVQPYISPLWTSPVFVYNSGRSLRR